MTNILTGRITAGSRKNAKGLISCIKVKVTSPQRSAEEKDFIKFQLKWLDLREEEHRDTKVCLQTDRQTDG